MTATQPAGDFSKGLEGVVAGKSSICSLGDTLRYRGYAIEELAESSTFEEVAWLILNGELPRKTELETFQEKLSLESGLKNEFKKTLESLPRGSAPMDALRSAVSLLWQWEGKAAGPDAAIQMLAKMPAILAAMAGKASQPWQAKRSLAWNLLHMLRGQEPSDSEARAFDVSLILYAEHEFNASTFAARITASTLSDYGSAIVSAIGTLKGPLHGGANEEVMRMFLEIGDPGRAVAWLEDALAKKKKIMGFGHRVYKLGDPRAPILRAWVLKLAAEKRQQKWIEMADLLQEVMLKKKGLHPNLDYPSAPLYYLLGIPIELYTPIFAAARVSGWSAHFFEQQADNRLIRPRAEYIGAAPRAYVPLAKR